MGLNMKVELSKASMNIGQQYEAILTTIDKEGKANAAPFGVRVLEEDKVMLKIFEGGNTIKNIKEKKEFIVNITNDPIMFSFATTTTIPEEYLSRINYEDSEFAYISNADAYFICKVHSLKEGLRKDEIKDSEVNVIKAEAVELKINNPCVKPMNRGMHALMESLVNYSRINIVNEETQAFYLKRFKESERIVKKVAGKEEKEAMEILKENLKKQGFDV